MRNSKTMKVLTLFIAMLFMSVFFVPKQTNAQVAETVAVVLAIDKVYNTIDNECDENRPDGGYTVCKGGECTSGKCITLRKRCDGNC